jgi:MYXO-CTERM domain-containing protein
MRILGLLCLVGLVCGSAAGGPLANDPNAWSDGTTTWCGTVSVQSFEGELKADVDYCVYWWSEYPGTDYTPAPGEFVYAYQVYVTGTGLVKKLSVGMLPGNDAGSIGHDGGLGEAGGHAPEAWFFTGAAPNSDTANWEWLDVDPLATHSDGLVYSSINVPQWWIGTVLNTGQAASGMVPSPSDLIPEPGALALLALGLVAAVRRRRR